MDPSSISQAQRLTEAFEQFNEVSDQLTSSYRLLEQRLRDVSTRAAPAGAGTAAAKQGLRQVDRFESILDSVPAGIVVLDGEGVVQHFNAAALDLLGGPLLGTAWRAVIDRAFTPQRDLEALTLRDGRAVVLGTNPLGKGPGQVILLQDVTQSHELRTLVQRHQRLSSMGEMVAALAHQVRTPLASSLLYVSQLEGSDLQSAAQRRAVERVRACLDHLGRVVDDMLAYARGGCFDLQALPVNGLLESVVQLTAPQLTAHHCKLEICDRSAGAVVRGNRDALIAALQNLIGNAAQACAEVLGGKTGPFDRGHLELTACRIGHRGVSGSVEIVVRDDGPGMPQEVRERIFDPFFTTKANGTGLGLPVVQAIVQAHDGALWLESEPGRGTAVGVRLPLDPGAGEPEAE